MSSRNMFSRNLFSRNMFSRNMFARNMFSRNMFSFGGWKYTKKVIFGTEVIYNILGKGCDFHTHARAWY